MELTTARIQHYLLQIEKTAICWNWKQSTTKEGYGQFWDKENKKNRLAHRVAYVIYKGKIPTGLHIDHLCRNRKCVNPKHLEAVTPRENWERSPITTQIIQKTKTHCKRGHQFTDENTYIIPTTRSRQCKRCALEWQRIYQPKYRLEKKMGLR